MVSVEPLIIWLLCITDSQCLISKQGPQPKEMLFYCLCFAPTNCLAFEESLVYCVLNSVLEEGEIVFTKRRIELKTCLCHLIIIIGLYREEGPSKHIDQIKPYEPVSWRQNI